MKKLIKTSVLILAVALFGIHTTEAQEKKSNLKYVDAKTLNIINKIDKDCAPFSRINSEKYDARKGLGRTSTGLAILFRTDSRIIDAKWTTLSNKIGNNSTPILHSGLDLYIRDNGKWIFAGVGRPTFNSKEHKFTVVKRMAKGVKEIQSCDFCSTLLFPYKSFRRMNLTHRNRVRGSLQVFAILFRCGPPSPAEKALCAHPSC